MASDADPGPAWERVAAELRAYRAAEQAAWGGIDDVTLARFIHDPRSLPAHDQARVQAALARHENVREAVAVVQSVLTGVDEPEEMEAGMGKSARLHWPEFAKAGVVTVLATLAQWSLSSVLTSGLSSSALAGWDWWQLMQRWLVGVGLGLCLLIVGGGVLSRWLGWDRRTRFFTPLVLMLLAVVAVSLTIARQRQADIRGDLNAMFLEHRWVGYDPPGFDPYQGVMPSLNQMTADLKRLHSDQEGGGGFDGLITFNARGTLAEIPRLAKQVGFKRVIMGIHIDRDVKGKSIKPVGQLAKARQAQDWVDGYCLGHNTPTRLDFATLSEWMAELRAATGKPVTTTAPLISYLGDRGQDLREIGDWYFPDVHGNWHFGATPEEILRQTRQAVLRTTELPRNKPVLLKMVGFPSAGGPGLSPAAQVKFYTEVCRDLYLPPGVHVSFFAAYDIPWKSHQDHPEEWSAPEQFVGLFRADGRPKPAVEVVRKGFPIQRRP